MSSIDISLLKYTWKGTWVPGTAYLKNDVVQYENAAYVCMKDIPREYEIGMDISVSTDFYRTNAPKILFKDRPFSDAEYWKLVVRGNTLRDAWGPHRIYQQGDIVRIGGDLYIAKSLTPRNSWVEDTVYWTKIFENTNPALKRNWPIGFANSGPVGWTRNNGNHTQNQTCDGNLFCAIDALGNAINEGHHQSGNKVSGRGIFGSGVNHWTTAGFSFVDWIRSTDVRSTIGVVLSNVGLPTPDGRTPRCIQWARNYWMSLFLFNNGEVYAVGRQGNGELGDSANNVSKDYPVRCTNQSATGHIGETLPKSFNQTKIIKVEVSNQSIRGTPDTTSCYALGDDGSFWSWGYNVFGQLGHGQSTPTASDQFSNKTVPTRIPATFFDNKRIVDFMVIGNQYTSVLAMDEDGNLWGWGSNYTGELGIGDLNTVSNAHPIPTRVGFDWKPYGGIKKMSYYHYSTTNGRASYILTNDGTMFMAGQSQGGMHPVGHMIGGNTSRNVFRFTKFINTGPTQLDIDNFWVVGDYAHNIFVREKYTGKTYAMGDNSHRTLGQHASHTFYFNAGGQSGGWSLVEGVEKVLTVTNTMFEGNTNSPVNNVYLSVVIVCEDGRAWAQGRNTYGALGLGWTGINFDPIEQNPETGGRELYQPVKLPPGAKVLSAHGMGSGAPNDICMWWLSSGQYMISGSDSEDRSASYPARGVQGSPHNRAQGLGHDRLTIHSIASD